MNLLQNARDMHALLFSVVIHTIFTAKQIELVFNKQPYALGDEIELVLAQVKLTFMSNF